ncbi:TPA: hypothetical protein ACGBG5_003447 [Enterococcus faecalis]
MKLTNNINLSLAVDIMSVIPLKKQINWNLVDFFSLEGLEDYTPEEIQLCVAQLCYYKYLESNFDVSLDNDSLLIKNIGYAGIDLASTLQDGFKKLQLQAFITRNPRSTIVEFSDYVRSISPLR